jgi:uncharacterized membrane protein (DUF485 family)
MGKDLNIEKYLATAKRFRALESKEDRLLLLLSMTRLVLFIGGIILIWYGFNRSILTGLFLLFVISGLFFRVLKIFSQHAEKKNFLGNVAIINQNEANALSGDLSAFDPGNSYTDIHHDFSYDVDMFGNNSLFQYINRTVTEYGRDMLAEWLSDPYLLSAEMVSRQQTIKELALKEEWRQEFMASGMKTPLKKEEISGLLEWMSESDDVKSSILKKILIFSLPASALVTFSLTVAGILPYPIFTMIFLLNLFYIAVGLKNTNEIHNSLTKKYNYLSSMKGLLKTFEKESFSSQGLNDIKSNIIGKKISAAVSVKKLESLIHAFDSRINIFAGFILNGFLLWDYQCIYRLEKWKGEYRNLFPVWLDMLGHIDAYISMGNYAYNNPGFAYPSISDKSVMFQAKNLGHQLIDEKRRVCNDFLLEKKGTVCIISGANMAGKSTFLRTVAVNYILGMTGAPVCASEMNFSPVRLFTSMRTTDSLSDNESYFYAELKRLKILKARVENGEPVFMILDEILKGTNSEDKSSGSKLFLRKIVASGGTGLIATHDTSLCKLETEVPGKIINMCFEIEIDGQNIMFDYKLHDGITQKMNAVFLMKQMGILE